MDWIQLLNDLGVPTAGILAGMLVGFFVKYAFDFVIKRETIRFSKLHERRAEVIEKLYSKLVDLGPKAEKYSITWEEKKDRIVFIDAALIFVDFSQKKKIFFDETTCKILDEIASKYTDFCSNMRCLCRDKNNLSKEDNEKEDRLMDEVKKIIRNKIPSLMEKLEKEFRKMLGAQE